MEAEATGSKAKHALISKGRVVAIVRQACSKTVFWQHEYLTPSKPKEHHVTAVSVAIGKGTNVTRNYALNIHSAALQAWLDYDEIEELFAGINVVKSFMINMQAASPESKDVYFCSRDGFRVGFTQRPNKPEQDSYVLIDGITYGLSPRLPDISETTGPSELEATASTTLAPLGQASDFDNLVTALREGQLLLDAWQKKDGAP
ncbi:hypothetical protein VB738_12685 [Cyanobium gracile UHCC 0139]|uniref:Uncharacterized protein n=1 Tax=Cyanobium gracile UHCC 0139 TaxID=3110308 RepID=A0ABU5RWF1_9CYAN|nr:hypothetical protein [Cyanobium gracile]MEA5392115.1 hypothetical protein [Cyanobium gracile UHCC 0139]